MSMLKNHEMKYSQNIFFDEWNKFGDYRINRPPPTGLNPLIHISCYKQAAPDGAKNRCKVG